MERVLLLSTSYEPLSIIDWKKAITLLTLGKVEVVDEYDRAIRSVRFSIRLPSILRLLKHVKYRNRRVKFSRQNIYLRDHTRCQYCGTRFPTEELTYDHVVPSSRGGKTTWDNIVTSCIQCNKRKGGRTPQEAGLRLRKKPSEPTWVPYLHITIGLKNTPDSWRDYLYWNAELDGG